MRKTAGLHLHSFKTILHFTVITLVMAKYAELAKKLHYNVNFYKI